MADGNEVASRVRGAMIEAQAGAPIGVTFTGTRSALFGLLFRGYLLMVPTIGIYRFWVTTAKRRFYWMNTVIDGDPLEYTGQPLQLLLGFLLALAVFLPIYVAFFFLSTQPGIVAVIGYAIVASLFWFLTGYAAYRGRDFRLSRTLWRGIRFDQKGSAMRYAMRRFLWSLLVVATLGLAYPFMAGSLWRYRYSHSWYGDRQFVFDGSWRTLAGPYYAVYGLIAVLVAIFIGVTVGVRTPGAIVLTALLALLVGGVGYFWYRAREASRMFSCVRIGEAAATVRVGGLSMFWQFVLYTLSLAAALVLLTIVGGFILSSLGFTQLATSGVVDASTLLRRGWTGVLAVIFGYLAYFAAFALMGEVFLGYGYWMLIARDASVTNLESLRTVMAGAEDKALMGEGLADAFNVGAY